MKSVFTLLVLLLSLETNAQLPDGSLAPDFTLTDIVDSNAYTLYDYLDAGKTVFVEIFAAHCPSCWAYHQSNTLKDLYTTYGPNGTDEVMVFALEYDEYNFYEAFVGIGSPWVTAGNWLDGTPYPIFQVEGTDRAVFDDYNVAFYPMVYMICPNKVTALMTTSLNATQLYDKISDCSFLSIEEDVLEGRVYVDYNQNIIVEEAQSVNTVEILNLEGQVVAFYDNVHTEPMYAGNLQSGVYIARLVGDSAVQVVRFVKN